MASALWPLQPAAEELIQERPFICHLSLFRNENSHCVHSDVSFFISENVPTL